MLFWRPAGLDRIRHLRMAGRFGYRLRTWRQELLLGWIGHRRSRRRGDYWSRREDHGWRRGDHWSRRRLDRRLRHHWGRRSGWLRGRLGSLRRADRCRRRVRVSAHGAAGVGRGGPSVRIAGAWWRRRGGDGGTLDRCRRGGLEGCRWCRLGRRTRCGSIRWRRGGARQAGYRAFGNVGESRSSDRHRKGREEEVEEAKGQD